MIRKQGLLIDLTLCIGCNACQDACKVENGLPEGTEEKLSPTAYTALREVNGTFVRQMCRHCLDPTCVSVCPVGALEKHSEGPVLYDESKCIGCRYCVQACPFQVPRYEWTSTWPRVQKCRFCAERLKKGMQTACAEACPTGATKFGDRDDLIREAQARIEAEPEKYVNHIYGLTEVGGTSVLYLSAVPFEELGFRTNLEQIPLPSLTWQALSKIPTILTVGGVFLYGIWWITNRRTEVQAMERSLKRGDGRTEGRGDERPADAGQPRDEAAP
jgi:formate dehydrogenase iron-sulfur subunit